MNLKVQYRGFIIDYYSKNLTFMIRKFIIVFVDTNFILRRKLK